jgi:putative inorganic carbon (hco3(-)) transporter
MGFFLFLLMTAIMLIRPGEQIAELRGVRLYESVILLCFACSFSSVIAQFTIRDLESRPISLCIFGLLAAVVLSHLSQGDLTKAGDAGFEFFKVVVYYVLLVGNVTTTWRFRAFIAFLGLCTLAVGTLAVLHYYEVMVLPEPEPVAGVMDRTHRNVQNGYVKEREYNPASGQVEDIQRLCGTGIFGDPNELSLVLTMGAFIALWGLTDSRQGVFRLGWVGPLLFFFYALSLTGSRGGLLGMLAGFMALLYVRLGWRATLMLGLPMVPVALALFGGRMGTISASEGTGQARIQIWSDGLSLFRSAPVFGIGLNELGNQVGLVAHNSFISAYAELGIFGGTLFFGAFFFAVLTLGRLVQFCRQGADPRWRHTLPFLAALVATYGTMLLSLSETDAVPTYLLLGLVTCAANVATGRVPALQFRLDGRLFQRLALASVGFLAASYVFVRLFFMG